jgi:hypothetical protein
MNRIDRMVEQRLVPVSHILFIMLILSNVSSLSGAEAKSFDRMNRICSFSLPHEQQQQWDLAAG